MLLACFISSVGGAIISGQAQAQNTKKKAFQGLLLGSINWT